MGDAGIPTPSPTVQWLPGSVNIPVADFPAAEKAESVDAKLEVDIVIETLNHHLANADYEAISRLFIKDGFWRDHLALTWEFRTIKGSDQVLSFLQHCATSRDGFRLHRIELDISTPARQPMVMPVDADSGLNCIHAGFRCETAIGSGEGTLRLVLDGSKWKIYTIYTSLRAIKDHQEATFANRARGVQHGGQFRGPNWAEKRAAETDFADTQPAVLIVGAGQAGLTAAVRLKMQGVDALVIERNDRIGDNWRKRYRHLVLHSSLWYEQFPYLSFPPQWPVFTPRDKIAQFLESYATLLDLDVWTKTELGESKWDEDKGIWTVKLSRRLEDGSIQTRVLQPRHIVQATGMSGGKNVPTFPGADSFKGDVYCHSSDFYCAKEGTVGRKAVVIGSCNSGLDIAQNYAENGYEVTMVQRSSTHMVSTKAFIDIAVKPLYSEESPAVEDADLIVYGIPSTVLKAMQIKAVREQKALDKEMLQGLERAGFRTDDGPDGSGLFLKYFQRGGGLYVDVGASKLIADGCIKIKYGQQVSEILPNGVRFADGSEVEADEIVLATGYDTIRAATRAMFGSEVADRVTDCWGLNEEGEMRTISQNSGHAGFWYHGGSFAMCRYFSRHLALQIKAQEEGLYKHGDI